MERFLRQDAEGLFLEQGDKLILAGEQAVRALDADGTLKPITKLPTIYTEADAWKAMSNQRSGVITPEVGQMTIALNNKFDRLYVLVLVATYEDAFDQRLPYTDLKSGQQMIAYKTFFMAGINAMLVEIGRDGAPNQIRLAASAFASTPVKTNAPLPTDDDSRIGFFRAAYEQAIDQALKNLVLQAKRFTGRESNSEAAMVTGYAIKIPESAGIFGYDIAKKPTMQSLSANMCGVEQACPSGSRCETFGALMAEGLSAALSRTGQPVLPTLGSEYLTDAEYALSVSLSLVEGRESLLGQFGRVEIRPQDASKKYVAVLHKTAIEDVPNEELSGVIIDRVFYSRLGFITAHTGTDGCTPISTPSGDGFGNDVYGCAAESYVDSQGPPDADTSRGLYVAATINQIETLGRRLKNGRAPGKQDCARLDGDR